MTKHQALRVRALASVNTPAEDIAEKLGLELGEVIGEIKENNHKVVRRVTMQGIRLTEEQKAEIAALHRQGRKVKDIADTMGVSAPTVCKIIKEAEKEPAPAATDTSSKEILSTNNDTTEPAESQALVQARATLIRCKCELDRHDRMMWELGELFARLGGAE